MQTLLQLTVRNSLPLHLIMLRRIHLVLKTLEI
nr:MAG TPA: hypothetical protein [Bacteriophage sp.]